MEQVEDHGGVKRSGRMKELQAVTLEKVADVSSSISTARSVDEVIIALHSIAALLFTVDASLLSECLDQRHRNQIHEFTLPSDVEMVDWWRAFYFGGAFPVMVKILVNNVASDWLVEFPISARKLVYDSFFVKGPETEVVQALIPCLGHKGRKEDFDRSATCSNIHRLLVICLIENYGVRHIVEELGNCDYQDEDGNKLYKSDIFTVISMLAQKIASIPDKAQPEYSPELSARLFFPQVVRQLLNGAEARTNEICHNVDASGKKTFDAAFLFVGEMFTRICRRGFADALVIEMTPRILNHVRSCCPSTQDTISLEMIESKPEYMIWSNMMDAINDQHTIERLCEQLLKQLSRQNVSDAEAYWTLWLLFQRTAENQIFLRTLFLDKFLLWKVFPLSCLRWILQYAVFDSTCSDLPMNMQNTKVFVETIQRLVGIWSKREFTQSSSLEQQAYVTAAVGLCLERMSKEDLEKTGDVLQFILRGVSCRLESPIHLVRKMASSVALVFSKIVDPKNPLHLDDDQSDTIDWQFGVIPPEIISAVPGGKSDSRKLKLASHPERELDGNIEEFGKLKHENYGGGSDLDHGLIALNGGRVDIPDDGSDSEDSSNNSLQPYDLSDDDSDLKRKITQIGEIIAALRKPDDPDGVERALQVAESLIRASPDELSHEARDLSGVLVHVRCSDIAVEGEEESSERMRQKALVALLVTCPFESLDTLNKLLYSPNVDVGQRLLIIDVMIDAALELSVAETTRTQHRSQHLISTVYENQPWFIPREGPSGAGPWKEVMESGTLLRWSHRYERELPSRGGQAMKGKSRRRNIVTVKDTTKNRFPLYAAAFMLPAMQGFDRRRHGVDLLGRDFIVLGKLIYMLAVCMKCIAMHPEASALAPAFLEMLRRREVSDHSEAYVRRSVAFAASSVLAAVHPSFVASSLIEGNEEVSKGLEWVRIWALHVAESDPDTECSSMAMTCLQLHAEMALETSRTLESADAFRSKTAALPHNKIDIRIPSSSTFFTS